MKLYDLIIIIYMKYIWNTKEICHLNNCNFFLKRHIILHEIHVHVCNICTNSYSLHECSLMNVSLSKPVQIKQRVCKRHVLPAQRELHNGIVRRVLPRTIPFSHENICRKWRDIGEFCLIPLIRHCYRDARYR